MFTVRQASIDDLNDIERIEKSFGADAFSRRSLRRLLSKTIVLDDGTLIGYCTVFFYKKTSRVYSIIIDKPYRGKGYSKMLLKNIIDLSKSKKMERIVLEVNKKNKTAVKLYESLGFNVIAELKDYYDIGKNALKYELRLK